MPDYMTMYFHLFNRITDALREMEAQNFGKAAELLALAQQEGEELFLESAADE